MDDKDLNQIEELFHGAIDLSGAERSAYLARGCGSDEALRHEIESLLAAHEAGNGFLDEHAVTLAMQVMSAKSGESMVGRELGSYKILSSLGKGGMGDVYLAEDRRLSRKVALKFLSSEFITDNWAKRQLIREAQAVAMLDHPNICAVYGIEELEEHSFIVMQYIEGQTLAEMVRSGSLTSNQVVPLAQQIVGALAEAHSHGIIHRDVKPKNIMVTPGGQIKILDFGLAKTIKKSFEEAESISQVTQAGLLVGTVAYMSPEQLRGEKLDYRTDIFSLGTVLYEIASGKNPYGHETNAEVISAIMRGEPQALRQAKTDCPKGLDRIVDKCLKKDRTERYQSAAELLIDLDKLQKGIILPAPARSFFNLRAAAMFAMLLLIFVVAAFIYLNWNRPAHTLAVLPIVCESSDQITDCPGPAITANLVRELERRSDLRIKVSPSAPSIYGPGAVGPQKLGRDLGADVILFGRIKRRDNSLVLQTRMENVKDGTAIAEEEYTLKPEELPLLEQELALRTTFSLQLPLSGGEKNLLAVLASRQNRDPEAFELYLRGRAYWNKRDHDNIQKAIDFFKQATERDPLYARAYAGLADCYVLMSSVAYGAVPTKDAMTKADWAAKQALNLDDNLPEAHTAMGVIWMRYHRDGINAEKEFKRAIALNPDFSAAHFWYSNLLAITERRDESVAESEIAKDLEPFSAPAIMNHCRALYLARKNDQADACLNNLAKEQPDYLGGKYIHGLVYLQQGKYQDATRIFEEVYAKDKAYGGALLGYCYGITNRTAEALNVLNEMQVLRTRVYLPPQELAIIYLGLNDLGNAFALMRAAADEKSASLAYFFVDPMFDNIRTDPRFVALAKDVKLLSRAAE
jgi:serine/threonine protein kinase/TolB-like protein